MAKARTIAFYLPQFYPTPENDEWWGKGFTEWTNVARSKPLFPGHYQPCVPADLGFYDLRMPEIREQQAALAKEAGIEGFCYWHYWFNGRRLLDRVFTEVVESGKPDYPFCLCWANHSWYAKTWDPNKPNRLLIEQTYPGEQDYINHFNAMLSAFKDKRYIRVNGKLLFGIFAPFDFDISSFSSIWNELAYKHGLGGFHFFAFVQGASKICNLNTELFDSVVMDPLLACFGSCYSLSLKKQVNNMVQKGNVKYLPYETYCEQTLDFFKQFPLVYPCINPNFDHSPRSGFKGNILHDSTPQKWGNLYRRTIEMFSYRPYEENLIFVKAWNEWGEGNYLEPDLKFGKEYIDVMHQINSTEAE